MKTLHFSIRIQAPRERVWQLMLAPDGYRQWTAAFCEGSYYEGSWEQGQHIRFLSPQGEGMLAEIAENRLYEFISIRHLGEIVGGVDRATSEKIGAWTNARENYTFSSDGAGTLVQVDVDTPPDFEKFMTEAWPRALSLLKTLCERDTARA